MAEEAPQAWPEEAPQGVVDYAHPPGSEGMEGLDGLPPLPEECGADKHPVVVLRNVYTREESEVDPSFFDDLEVRCGLLTWCEVMRLCVFCGLRQKITSASKAKASKLFVLRSVRVVRREV